MRNLFDQYNEPENRLTHALMTSLNEDRKLLSGFIKWAIDRPAPDANLEVLEQSWPGELEPQNLEKQQNKGLPDGCIHDHSGWALLIESKIKSALDPKQLAKHLQTARTRKIEDAHMLALVATNSKPVSMAVTKKWTDLYIWLKSQEQRSQWAERMTKYMEVLEEKLPSEQYLKKGSLTAFTGIPFGKDKPYNYDDAKRVIRLAMEELRSHQELNSELGVYLERPLKPAIKGKNGDLVWDCFWPKGIEKWTAAPHLSVGIHRYYLNAVVIVPDKVATAFRNRLRDVGFDKFQVSIQKVLANFNSELGGVAGAAPWGAVYQRHYRHQGAVPDIDAELQFDLRTAFQGDQSAKVKPQHEWLQVAYEAFRGKRSNIQLEIGVRFPYEPYSTTKSPKILNHIVDAWLACKPFIQTMIHE